MVGIVEGTRREVGGGGQGGKVEVGTIMLGNVHHPCKCLAHVI